MADALLLVGDSESNQNIYYKTRFLAGDPFVYVEIGSGGLLVTSPMEHGRATKESTVAEVKTFDDFGFAELVKESNNREHAFSAVLARIVQQAGRTIRVEGAFPLQYADHLRSDGVTLDIDRELLKLERRRKSPEEIRAIEQAQRATERATAHAIEILKESVDRAGTLHFGGTPLTSERLRTEIEIALIKEQMDPGTPIVAGGPGAADPHWLGSGPLKTGEAIVMDIFPRGKQSRYFADMTRTVVKGEPRPGLRAMYDAVLAAQEAALARIRAGANGRDVHTAVVDTFRDHGFTGDGTGPRFIHGTGHGVGLDIHEGPSLGVTNIELLEGDVVTVEPGLYDPELGAIRIEDLVVVTADGYQNLTDFSKAFLL